MFAFNFYRQTLHIQFTVIYDTYTHALWWETVNKTERSVYEVRKMILK